MFKYLTAAFEKQLPCGATRAENNGAPINTIILSFSSRGSALIPAVWIFFPVPGESERGLNLNKIIIELGGGKECRKH